MLFALGCLGILLHNLIKMNDINRASDGHINLWQYFKLERFSILISVIIVVVCIIAKEEVIQLEQFGKYLGLGFMAIGYMGQSILVWRMGKAAKFMEDGEKKQ